MRQYDRYLGESAPAVDRFAIQADKSRQALTQRAHEDPVLPGFVVAKKKNMEINVCTFAAVGFHGWQKPVVLPELPKDFNPKHVFTTPGPAFTQHKTGESLIVLVTLILQLPSKLRRPLLLFVDNHRC
jgi:hypothetical protein